MADRLGVEVAGFGVVAGAHLRAYREITAVEVASVAETQSALLTQPKTGLGIPCYSSLDEMLDSEALDIVCVFTPPPFPGKTRQALRRRAWMSCVRSHRLE
jgi:predicted dehydrogenase